MNWRREGRGPEPRRHPDRFLYKEPSEDRVAPTYTAQQGTDSHISVLRWKLILRGTNDAAGAKQPSLGSLCLTIWHMLIEHLLSATAYSELWGHTNE